MTNLIELAEEIVRSLSPTLFQWNFKSDEENARVAAEIWPDSADEREHYMRICKKQRDEVEVERATKIAQVLAILRRVNFPLEKPSKQLTCVHCGVELGVTIGGGLYVHATSLQRCQGVKYGHMGHPEMPCPSGTVNDCIGSQEYECTHIYAEKS